METVLLLVSMLAAARMFYTYMVSVGAEPVDVHDREGIRRQADTLKYRRMAGRF
ncbi:MAG: hypothetical protein LC650_00615 [Actinobacteria bacterium]|nr:hypothetical protein [Actinomycetota bacterium]